MNMKEALMNPHKDSNSRHRARVLFCFLSRVRTSVCVTAKQVNASG